MADPAHIGSLDELAANPALAAALSAADRSRLLARAASALAALSAVDAQAVPQSGGDRLLTADQAAEVLAVPRGWLYRRGKRLGLTAELSSGTLRYSSTAIEAFIARGRLRALDRRRRSSGTP
ncbi:MAG TPA: hypothetical protein VNF29_06695 [Candidatus Binataceae bacterium]|nr:hypothetical protein [Candidatus Binataceae bacterium]